MSDQRRFTRKSGRLTSTPINDGWAIDLDSRDPAIPNLPLETPAAAPDATALISHQHFCAPQQTAAREFVGYAVSFAALGALLAGTPPTQGAANYNVGSQQTVLANSQNRSWVKGTNPTLIPAAVQAKIVRPINAGPQQVDSGSATLFQPGIQYLAVVSKTGVTLVAAPQQVDSGDARLTSPGTEYLAVVNKTAGTLVSAPEQIESGAATVYGPEPPPVAGTDVAISKTRVSMPQEVESARFIRTGTNAPFLFPQPQLHWRWFQADQEDPSQRGSRIWGTATDFLYPEPIQIWHWFQSDQENPTQPGSRIWGRVVEQAAGTDAITNRTRFAAPERIDTAWAKVWTPNTDLIPPTQAVSGANYTLGGNLIDSGAFIRIGKFVQPAAAGTDTAIGITRVSAPEQIDSGSAHLTGFVESVAAEAAPILGRTRISAPQQVESGFAHILGQAPASVDHYVARYYVAEQESTEQPSPGVWGISAPTAVGTDVAVGITRISAPHQIDSGAATLFGYTSAAIVGTDTAIAATKVSAPQQIESGFVAFHRSQVLDTFVIGRYYVAEQEDATQSPSSVWGTAVAVPPGTDVPVGVFRSYGEPFYEPVQYGLALKPNADLIPPPAVVVIEPPRGGDDKPDSKHKHPGWDKKRALLKLSKEQELANDIRRIYRELTKAPELQQRAEEIILSATEKPVQLPIEPDRRAELARQILAEIASQLAIEQEIALRLLYQQLLEQEMEEDDMEAINIILGLI